MIVSRFATVVLFWSIVSGQTNNEPTASPDFHQEDGATHRTSSPGLFNVKLQKCCSVGMAVSPGNCTETSLTFLPKFPVHQHNDTHLDDVPINSELIYFDVTIRDPCTGVKVPLSIQEAPMMLLNGSLIVVSLDEYEGIVGPDQFCVDNLNHQGDDTVYPFLCIKDSNGRNPGWIFLIYIVLSAISASLFVASAVFFYYQEVESDHKKCFMGYAFSMSVSYLTIILTQFVSGWCRILGLSLQFFVTWSFFWLAALCIDVAITIRAYKVRNVPNRFSVYLVTSLVISVLFLGKTATNNFVPDIPTSFFKPQFERTICHYLGEEQHRVAFYVPVISALVISLASLIYSFTKMNRIREKNRQIAHSQKLPKKFRYMSSRLMFVFVAMIIWFSDSFSDLLLPTSGITLIILAVQALQGFVIVPLFTMKLIQNMIDVNKKPRIENLEDLIEESKNYRALGNGL